LINIFYLLILFRERARKAATAPGGVALINARNYDKDAATGILLGVRKNSYRLLPKLGQKLTPYARLTTGSRICLLGTYS
jgi:hypothetical protein